MLIKVLAFIGAYVVIKKVVKLLYGFLFENKNQTKYKRHWLDDD